MCYILRENIILITCDDIRAVTAEVMRLQLEACIAGDNLAVFFHTVTFINVIGNKVFNS